MLRIEFILVREGVLKEVKLNKGLFYYMQQNNDLNFEPQDVNIVNLNKLGKQLLLLALGMQWSGLTLDYTRI